MIARLKSSWLPNIIMILALSFLCSCSDPNGNDGPCTYMTYPGTSVFTELRPVTSGYEVYFDFILSDPTGTTRYLGSTKGLQFGTWTDTGWQTIFSSDWLSANGIYVGASVSAEYKEETSGCCTPAYISFPTITGGSGS